jgi:hypothetical protein
MFSQSSGQNWRWFIGKAGAAHLGGRITGFYWAKREKDDVKSVSVKGEESV